MITAAEKTDNENLSERFLARLQSLFELAASYVLKCLENPREDDISQLLNKLNIQRIQSVKELCMRQLHTMLVTDSGTIIFDRISAVLRDCLIDFYSQVCSGLNVSEMNCMKRRLMMFPAGHNVDWEELLNLYYQVENDTKEIYWVLPDAAIEYAITREFFNTALYTELARKQFDDKITQEGLDRLHNLLGYGIQVWWEAYWSSFDKPPYAANILNLKQIASTSKFRGHQLRYYGFPTSLPARFSQRLDPKEVADAITMFAESHALKAQQLIDQAELDAYTQSDSLGAGESEKLPQLIVSSAHREAIAQALEPYISSGFDSLKCLLASQAGTEPIVIQGRPMNGVAYLFRQAQESDHIVNAKTDLARWLVYWFRQQEKDGQKEWAYTSVYPVLTKGEKPAKSSRIPYQP